MRGAIIWIFLSAILIQSGFVSVYTVVRIRAHKAAVKAIMKSSLKSGRYNDRLEVFRASELDGAAWVHSAEFILGENKYDVVRLEQSPEGVVYHCINDVRETELYRSLDHQSERSDVLQDVLKKFCMAISGSVSELPVFEAYADDPVRPDIAYRFLYAWSPFRPPSGAV